MPIYEYRCNKCHKEFECLVIGSNNSISCPACNDKGVERMMSACSFKSTGSYSSSSSSGCATCSSGNCSTCH